MQREPQTDIWFGEEEKNRSCGLLTWYCLAVSSSCMVTLRSKRERERKRGQGCVTCTVENLTDNAIA